MLYNEINQIKNGVYLYEQGTDFESTTIVGSTL
jgi:hypothetical protein